MAAILEANKVDMSKYNQVQFTRRVRMMPVDDLVGAIRAIADDWGNDILTAKTSAGLVLADLCYYAGIDAAEALGPGLSDQLKKRGVL